MILRKLQLIIKPFLANVPSLYPLKIPENLWSSGVFRGYKTGTLTRNGLNFSRIYRKVKSLQLLDLAYQFALAAYR